MSAWFRQKLLESSKGSILVIILLVISSMTIIAMGLAYRTRIQIQLVKSRAERIQAYYLARGGVERVEALIHREKNTPKRTGQICGFFNSAKNENLFGKLTSGEGNKFRLIYFLKDELSYLNVNKSDPSGWEKLKSLGEEEIASILDWIDEDNEVKPQGAEADFYQGKDLAYLCKNSELEYLKELLFVKTVTRERYLGKNLLDFSFDREQNNKQFRYLFDNSKNLAETGLTNIFTVFGDGRININTSSSIIISTFAGLEQGTADYIVNYRSGADGQAGTGDDKFITDSNGIFDLEQLSDLQAELLQQYCCYASDYFRIYSCAKTGETKCCLMAIMKLSKSKGQIISFERFL